MNSLNSLLTQLYSPEQTIEIINALSLNELTKQYNSPQWHKNIISYSVYPFSFCENDECTLYQLTNKLDYIKDLGINTIHILPPFDSPMIDNGFDVNDYYSIRSELGGNDAFDHFLVKARSKGIRIFLDFVLNHISDQHDWFQKAISGDEYYRNFFLWRETKPEFIRLVENEDGIFGRYKINGIETDIRIIFPDHAGAIPHWTQASDGNWYFHTFYPQQIDLDWFNPNVFIEMYKVISFWAQKGVSFRLDAIRHIGKRWEDGLIRETPETFKLVQALHKITELLSPESVFLVEANTDFETLNKYWGNEKQKATDLAYNFQLTEAIWISLILQNTTYLWDTLSKSKDIPAWGQWITFLRNHDGIAFWYASDLERMNVLQKLTPKGLAYPGAHAASGRTASLLDNDSTKIIMAHFLLFSLPGSPSIIYGDEVGKPNDFDYMNEQTAIKQQHLGTNAEITNDIRDINRGYITNDLLNDEKRMRLYSLLKEIIQSRMQYSCMSVIYPNKIENLPSEIFAAKYDFKETQLSVYINLSNEEHIIEVPDLTKEVLSINGAHYSDATLTLPSYAGAWLTI